MTIDQLKSYIEVWNSEKETSPQDLNAFNLSLAQQDKVIRK